MHVYLALEILAIDFPFQFCWLWAVFQFTEQIVAGERRGEWLEEGGKEKRGGERERKRATEEKERVQERRKKGKDVDG